MYVGVRVDSIAKSLWTRQKSFFFFGHWFFFTLDVFVVVWFGFGFCFLISPKTIGDLGPQASTRALVLHI